VLDEMVNVLADAPGIPVEIGGHTDARGPAIFNQTLSQRRARACLRYLAQKGVAAQRLSSKGYGSTKPLADNNTPEGQQRNRRIEFTVQKVGK
jgi:outer membrane protein OmpA-like peptidoglycan-associated protein